MTSTEGDFFAQLAEQTNGARRDLSTELMIAVVVVAWLMVLLGGYLVLNA